MLVSVDTTSPVPVYAQLRSQLQRLIASGQLPAGARLPTIRQLAADLGLASATVSRVYEMLAADGWVAGAGRRGTVVQSRPRGSGVDEEVRATAEHLALLVHQLGLSRSAIDKVIDEALRTARTQDRTEPVSAAARPAGAGRTEGNLPARVRYAVNPAK